jgi:hypothetical protein
MGSRDIVVLLVWEWSTLGKGICIYDDMRSNKHKGF